jgi:hypothetical protein
LFQKFVSGVYIKLSVRKAEQAITLVCTAVIERQHVEIAFGQLLAQTQHVNFIPRAAMQKQDGCERPFSLSRTHPSVQP